MHGIRIICILAVKDDPLNHLLREYDCLNEGPAKKVVRFQMQPIATRDFACEPRPRQPRQFLPAATPFRPMRRLGGEAQALRKRRLERPVRLKFAAAARSSGELRPRQGAVVGRAAPAAERGGSDAAVGARSRLFPPPQLVATRRSRHRDGSTPRGGRQHRHSFRLLRLRAYRALGQDRKFGALWRRLPRPAAAVAGPARRARHGGGELGRRRAHRVRGQARQFGSFADIGAAMAVAGTMASRHGGGGGRTRLRGASAPRENTGPSADGSWPRSTRIRVGLIHFHFCVE